MSVYESVNERARQLCIGEDLFSALTLAVNEQVEDVQAAFWAEVDFVEDYFDRLGFNRDAIDGLEAAILASGLEPGRVAKA